MKYTFKTYPISRSFCLFGEKETKDFWEPRPVSCELRLSNGLISVKWRGSTPRPVDVLDGLRMAYVDGFMEIDGYAVENTLHATRVWTDQYGNTHARCAPKDWDAYEISESWYGRIGKIRGKWFLPEVLVALLSALTEES